MKATDTFFERFGLDRISEEERNGFLDEVGDLVMKAVFRKAWIELSGEKREQLTQLLEESGEDPENMEKLVAVLNYLDEHVENVREYAIKEVESIEKEYQETKNALEELGE